MILLPFFVRSIKVNNQPAVARATRHSRGARARREYQPARRICTMNLERAGLKPFHVPLGIRFDEKNPRTSACIRCNTCDGHPCLIGAKADAQTICVDPALEHERFAKFSAVCERADGLVLVVPEYNHGHPGMLKHVLDSNLKEYIHKAVGVCGVSAGGFGGVRVIENLLPVLRELGLVTIFWDGNFSGAQKLFGEEGMVLDEATHVKRIDKFLGELILMSKVPRYGRENVSI